MKKKREPFGPLNQCEHPRMRWCCFYGKQPCGHLECPDCGMSFDLGSDVVCAHDRAWDNPKWMLWL
jgi:hypothetical protein